MRAPLLLLPLALCAACLRQTEFRCQTNDQCGPNGTCEAVGYCSFPGDGCQQFGESAGPYAGQCVGGQGGDGGIDDAPPGDAPPMSGCPAGYTPLPGAPPDAHRYRKAPSNTNWMAQRTFCMQTAPATAYLAIPDDAAELAALATIAGGTPFWIGISDTATEGTFLTVRDAVPPFLMWAPNQPDNAGNGEDCVAATATLMSDERCQGGGGDQKPAVCECEP